MTPDQVRAVSQVCDAIVEAVREAGGQGAPAGPLYAALMNIGCSLEQFEMIMNTLVAAGRLTKRGECYFDVQVPELPADYVPGECYTLANGECIGIGCMHDPTPLAPALEHSKRDWPAGKPTRPLAELQDAIKRRRAKQGEG